MRVTPETYNIPFILNLHVFNSCQSAKKKIHLTLQHIEVYHRVRNCLS